MLLRAAAPATRLGGVELVAIDRGPGMADVHALSPDGHSTAGTLGIGLGAIAGWRAAFDVYSRPGAGTVLAAPFWPSAVPGAADRSAGLTRPLDGRGRCGDAYAVRPTDRRLPAAALRRARPRPAWPPAASARAPAAFRDRTGGVPRRGAARAAPAR